MYHNFSELQDYCDRSHVLLWEAVLKNEIRITHEPKELIYDRPEDVWQLWSPR